MLPQENKGWFHFREVSRQGIPARPQEEYRELADLKYAIDQSAIVTTADINGNIIYVNDMALKVYGYGREEMLGKNHRLLNSGVHSKSFFKELWDTILVGEVWRGEVCNKSKGGSLHWLDTTIVPFVDENGKPHHFMSIRKDITVKKRMEEDLRHEQRKRFSIERLSAVGEMAANIAHEIKNPLAAIQLQAQLLQRSVTAGTLTPESALSAAEKIGSIAGRINNIIKGLLSLTRDADSDPLERISVKKLIDDTLEFCAGNLNANEIAVLRDETEGEFFVECRPIQISQVLLNLINNARDAICKLEVRWIRIEVKATSGQIQISVSDSGTNLTPKIRARIMEPFFTTKKDGKGTGLGLSISRKIVEKHGGELSLANSRYTCFVVKLPEAPGLH